MNIRLLAPFALSLLACAAEPAPEASGQDFTEIQGDVRFECSTTGSFYGADEHRVSFTVADARETLAPESASLYDAVANEDDELVSVSPDNSKLWGLNENGGAVLDGGKLIIDGDSDGFYLVKLVLYKNSGFTKGYVALKDIGEGIGNQYSKITCSHQQAGGDRDGIDPNADVGTLVAGLSDQWDLPDYAAPARMDLGPYHTDSNDPMEMLAAFVVEQDEDPADFEFEQDASSFDADVQKAGLVNANLAVDQVTESLGWYFEDFEDFEGLNVDKRVERAGLYMRALADKQDVVFGYYGYAQSGCAAPVNLLLVLNVAEQTIWAVELEPCSES